MEVEVLWKTRNGRRSMKKLLRRMMKQQTKHLKLTIKMALKG
jgi:hypothetical protein